jgi:rubrerythrin
MAQYIERAKVTDALIDNTSIVGNELEEAVNAICAIPAADVRPVVRGKWRPYSPLTDTYECDKCGYQVIDESFRTNFCPNCGADMMDG